MNFKRFFKKQVFLKECKETEEKEVTHIKEKLNDFSYSPGESDEELIFFDKFLIWLFFSILLTF